MIDDPEILATFRVDGSSFTSRNGGGFISCPPYVIASIASRVPPGVLELPAGYDLSTLEQIKAITGWADQDTHVSARQAAELAQIGWQILELQARGEIDPPPGYLERQSIAHLVSLVAGKAER